eukprot:m.59015 g.59015  ORF g.59015 m.59015 type:complete len:918 (+) comp34855_c0_seq13:42-2795(+)
MSEEISSIKQRGNDLFGAGKYEEAVKCYTTALNHPSVSEDVSLALYKNRAACYIKLERYDEAVEDASESLKSHPFDVKALFRRSQAYERLGRLEEAYKDVRNLIRSDPKNSAAVSSARRLMASLSAKADKYSTTEGKLSHVVSQLRDGKVLKEDKIKAAKTLAALVQNEAARAHVMSHGDLMDVVSSLISHNCDKELAPPLIHCLASLCTASDRVLLILDCVQIDFIKALILSAAFEISKKAIFFMDCALGALVPTLNLEILSDGSRAACSLFEVLMNLIKCSDLLAESRDCLLEVVMKVTPLSENIAPLFFRQRGLESLLLVAENALKTKEKFGESTCPMSVTCHTQMHVSASLAKLYGACRKSSEREEFQTVCSAFVRERLQNESLEDRLAALSTISSLMQGIPEIGGKVFGDEVTMTEVIKLGKLDNLAAKQLAAEAIAHAASDKGRCTAILSEGFTILKDLYKSKHPEIRVRALVGLCKLASTGGGNAGEKPLAEGSTVKLYKAAKRFIIDSASPVEIKKWAAEGLAFLSLDADVKESIIEEEEVIQSLLTLAKTGNPTVVFGVASTFVNLTNSYEKKEMDPQMEEFGRLSGQYIPKPHEKDAKEFVENRIEALMKCNVTTALVALASTESDGCRELLSRIFLALTTEHKYRGHIVQQGGAKVLVPLALQGTDKGKHIAAQALAKIAITTDPKMAFPGQRMMETVRPLVGLLRSDECLQQFEALMGLTNLSSVDDDVRNRIVAEKGISYIESLQFDDHDMLRRAATECMCNLIMNDKVFQMYVDDSPTERVKLMTLFAGEDDFELARAASGAIAMLSMNEKICEKMMAVKSCVEIMQQLMCSEKAELQHRGAYIMANLISASKEIAGKIIADKGLELLMAVSKQPEGMCEKAKEEADRALNKLTEWDLIKPAN